MELSVGDTVGGRFTVRERIGAGGFSTVWVAHDGDTGQEVALKSPAVGVHGRAEVHRRFERELAVLGPFADAITHSGVVRYVDGNVGSEPWFVALELLRGDPLVDLFGTDALGTSVRRRLAEELAETLDFLHRNGVVYLDLKPENVVLCESGRAALVDFNTAARLPVTADTVFEADQFKPPELLANPGAERDREVGPWSDVYSWGKLAFYLFTGVKVLTENVPSEGVNPLDFGGSCSGAVAEVVRRATVPAWDERYADGPALAAALADATGTGPRLLLTHPATGVACAVAPGHTIGRLSESAPAPRVVLPDPRRYVSPRHARFGRSRDGWVVEDTSLNGTYVRDADADDWTLLLSDAGYEARRDRVEGRPPTSGPVRPGTAVAPIHPTYGIELRVAELDG